MTFHYFGKTDLEALKYKAFPLHIIFIHILEVQKLKSLTDNGENMPIFRITEKLNHLITVLLLFFIRPHALETMS